MEKIKTMATKLDEYKKMLNQTDLEILKSIDCSVNINNILLDIKDMIKDYYLASLEQEGNDLYLFFNNGQEFKISIAEIK